jgi:hypothetical protein
MVLVSFFIPAPAYIDPNISNGFKVLWDPIIILALQILWLVFFLVFGRSTITTSTVSFDLVTKQV